MRRLGTLTIGQAPRPDIVPILDAFLNEGITRIHAGVLDELTRTEIENRFAPRPGQPRLVTRLLDGSSVVLDRVLTEAAAQHKLEALEEQGCTTILLLCTGHFERLTTRTARLLEPDRFLPAAVAALVRGAKLGIIVPIVEQIDSEAIKWSKLDPTPLYAAASPYQDGLGAVAEAALDLRQRGADILLMDCMGFVERHRAAASAAGLPTILSNSLMAKLVSEVL
jgi:protein AroM